VPCLSRLNEGILLAAVALGAKAVYLSPGQCEGCKYEARFQLAKEVVKNANQTLGFFGLPELVSFRAAGEVEVRLQEASRREFLTNLVQGAKKSGSVLAVSMLDQIGEKPPEKKRGALPVYLPVKRQLLLHSMRKFGNPTVGVVKSPLFCQFGATDDCTGCQMCAFFALVGL